MPNANALPSLEVLQHLFTLDYETGALFWNDRHESEFAHRAGYGRWVRDCKGKRADKPKSQGYSRVRLVLDGKRQIFSTHRIVFKMAHGFDPLPEVDHIDRDRMNNRPSNLRAVDRSTNCRNRTPRASPAVRSSEASE